MGLKIKVGYPRVDIAATERAIHYAMIEEVVDIAKSWVIDTTNLVPVWSGASKASFLKLAAKTKTALSISPVAPSRMPWGIGTSEGELIIDKGKIYGFVWSSELPYIHIVDQRYRFLDAGKPALTRSPILPQPIIVST